METKFNSEVGTVTFRLKEPNSDKPTLIKGIYLFKDFQTGFTTGIKVLPKDWEKTEKKILSGENKKELNNKLNKFKTKIPDFHNKFNEQYNRLPTKEELKTIVTNAINERELKTVNKKKKNFDDIYNDFMEIIYLKRDNAIAGGLKPLHKSYISSFNVAYADLKKFASENRIVLDIDTFDVTTCLKFQNWLLNGKDKKQSATVKTRIKRISQLLRWAFTEGYTNNRSFMQNDFLPKAISNNKIALTEEEITILYQYDFSNNKRLEKVRDLFILGCHTSLRFEDLMRINPKHIDFISKTIHILTSKVDKNVSFPFFGYTEEILLKYGGNINSISLSNQNANLYLKEIFREIPYFKEKVILQEIATNKGVKFIENKYEDKITFHNSRTSFCTNRYMEGWDLLEIWEFTGHTNEGTFKSYFKPTSEHERIRRENILLRNEKLQRADLQSKQIEELQKQIEELKNQNGKIINLNAV